MHACFSSVAAAFGRWGVWDGASVLGSPALCMAHPGTAGGACDTWERPLVGRGDPLFTMCTPLLRERAWPALRVRAPKTGPGLVRRRTCSRVL